MLELKYPIEADEHGVIDGIRLSTAMIRSAVDVLIPYIGTCGGCIDTAFGKIANEVLEAIHQEIKNGDSNAMIFTPGLNGAERDAAITAHMDDSQEAIHELLLSGRSEEDVHVH